jgi:hypothetical protein
MTTKKAYGALCSDDAVLVKYNRVKFQELFSVYCISCVPFCALHSICSDNIVVRLDEEFLCAKCNM